MKNWFNDVFLNSIFEKCEKTGKNGCWLTAKQTNVCLRNMEVNNYRVQVDFDLYYRQLSGSCVYSDGSNEYNVFLKYSKKNGCSYIAFNRIVSDKEMELHRKAREQELLYLEVKRKMLLTIEISDKCRHRYYSEKKYLDYKNDLINLLKDFEEELKEEKNSNNPDPMMIEDIQYDIEYHKKRFNIIEEVRKKAIEKYPVWEEQEGK